MPSNTSKQRTILPSKELRPGKTLDIKDSICVISGDVPKGMTIRFYGDELKITGHIEDDVKIIADFSPCSIAAGNLGNHVSIHCGGSVNVENTGTDTTIEAKDKVEFDSVGDHAKLTAGSISCRTDDLVSPTEGTDEKSHYTPDRKKVGDHSILVAKKGDIHIFDGGSHLSLTAKKDIHFTEFGSHCHCHASGERITYEKMQGSGSLRAKQVTGKYPGPGTAIYSDNNPEGLNFTEGGLWTTGYRGAEPCGLGILKYTYPADVVTYLIPDETYDRYNLKDLYTLIKHRQILHGTSEHPFYQCLSASYGDKEGVEYLDKTMAAFIKNPDKDFVTYALVSKPMLEGKMTPLRDKDGFSAPFFPN